METQQERGDEPLILSEFGSHGGLPDPRDLVPGPGGQAPWWFGARAVRRAARRHGGPGRGTGPRPPVSVASAGLVRATQEHQWEALRYEIAELRRHASHLGCYVITELSDIYWEANGLLDLARRPKAFHERFAAYQRGNGRSSANIARARPGGRR